MGNIDFKNSPTLGKLFATQRGFIYGFINIDDIEAAIERAIAKGEKSIHIFLSKNNTVKKGPKDHIYELKETRDEPDDDVHTEKEEPETNNDEEEPSNIGDKKKPPILF